jgi:hypothetical protein
MQRNTPLKRGQNRSPCVSFQLTNSRTPIEDLETGKSRWNKLVVTAYIPLRLQSAHTLFSGFLTRSLRVLVNFSVVVLSGFDIVHELVVGRK